jgi:hypothetical protein
MRKLMIKCMIFFLCVLIFEGFASDCICNVNALSIRKEQTRVYLFAVPNGGWSSCRVNIVYTEEYTHSSLNIEILFTSEQSGIRESMYML